ncbi:ABC transporter substrate-binding protein [Pseudochelatococcus sp. B33]
MLKKTAFLLVAVSLFTNAAMAGEKVNLWHVFNLESDIIYIGIEQFNAAQDEYEVEGRLIPSNQYVSELIRAIATGSSPDVVTLNDPYVASFSAQGTLTDLTDMIGASNAINPKFYYPGPMATSAWGDHLYTVPRDTNTLALYYNADLFRSHGLDPDKPPKTWSELREVATKLTGSGVYGLGFSANMASDGVFHFLPFLFQAGGSISHLDAPEAVEALQFWTDLVKAGVVSRDVVNQRQYEVASVFMSGGNAMAVGGPWELPRMQTDAKFDWRVAVLPVHDKVQKPASALGGYHYAIPSGAQNVKGAFKFLEFMSDPKFLNAGWSAGRLAPRTDVVLENPQWPKAYAVYREQLQSAIQRGPHPQWPEIERAINVAIQEALTGVKTPEEALAGAAATVAPILAATPL